jgi:prepilin-type N-terminal cleavage/methylation domain-containing protein/prepilin-type processing-associated H-X9-DG protein
MKREPAPPLNAGTPERLLVIGRCSAAVGGDRAFTLIELLVVIAIIAVLVGLLLPALSGTRQVTQSAACKSRLRHLGVALHLYTSDFGVYPNASAKLERYLIQTRPGPGRTNSEAPTSPAGLFQCPTRLSYWLNLYGSVPWPEGPEPSRSNTSLGLALTCPTDPAEGPFLPERDVAVPSDMFGSGDTTVAGWTSRGRAPLFQTGLHFQPEYAHRPSRDYPDVGVANMLFCDGHVDEGRKLAWENRSDAARRRWNRDHLPHSEYFAE